MTLVLGIDSSTQSTKALLVDADDGTVVEQRVARHPEGTEVDPRVWLAAYDEAAGPLVRRAQAIAVGGQQHGAVVLDEAGEPVHDALLWNDLRSATAADDLVAELGGPAATAELTGSVLNASFTVTKLRWLRDHAAAALGRAHRVLLPHDYLTWHLAGRPGEATTDRGDASGTGYWSPHTGDWLPEVLARAAGRELVVPRVAAPGEVVGQHGSAALAAGTGDNMAAALGLGLGPGDAAVSVGTSGVVSMVAAEPTADASGEVAGFADATGRFLPLACTVNASRVLDLAATLLGVDHEGVAALALASEPGAHGLTLLPYLDGERTPSRPEATGVLRGLTSATSREDLARAHVEGLLLSLADALAAMRSVAEPPARALLIGGAARHRAVRTLAPAVLGVPVSLPEPGEYVALGAARQAAWARAGTPEPPAWPVPATVLDDDGHDPAGLQAAYADLRDRTSDWTQAPPHPKGTP